jgi:hypothetical protein
MRLLELGYDIPDKTDRGPQRAIRPPRSNALPVQQSVSANHERAICKLATGIVGRQIDDDFVRTRVHLPVESERVHMS